MSGDDVYPYEMNEPDDFDEAAGDALLSGNGRDARLADLLGDIRVAYTSTPPTVGAELSALMQAPQPAATQSFLSRRFEQMRLSILAKVGVAAATIVAATGGLAAANALPAPVQDAVSHLGIAASSHGGAHHHARPMSIVDPTTTTAEEPTSATTAPNGDQEADEVCENDTRAADGQSQADEAGESNDVNNAPCDSTTTVGNTTTTTIADDTPTTGDHVDGEHVDGEHVDGEHVDGEHVDGEHVDGEHVDGEHVDGEHVDGEHHDGDTPTTVDPVAPSASHDGVSSTGGSD